jgi:hypothetical protein
MASPIIPTLSEETDGPDTQTVGRLLWEELHGSTGMQQPAQFEWLPLQPPPATTAGILQSNNNNNNNDSTPTPSSTRLSTPAASETEAQVASAGFVGPPDLALWRQRLFQLNDEETVTLSSEQWQHYWPFVSNVWTRNNAYTTQKRKQTARTHWNCRLHKINADTSTGEGQRNRQVRRTIGCPAKLTEVHDTLSGIHVFSMEGRHSHPLASLDETKINDGVKSWVETQVLQGFSTIAIVNAAAGKGKDPSSRLNLLDAGGCRLDTKYVRNAMARLNVRLVKPRHVVGKVPAEIQGREALEWLQSHDEEWKSAYLETEYKGKPSPGLVFARKKTITTLRERGVLTLMDSTHNTNQKEW